MKNPLPNPLPKGEGTGCPVCGATRVSLNTSYERPLVVAFLYCLGCRRASPRERFDMAVGDADMAQVLMEMWRERPSAQPSPEGKGGQR
jgi:hypothetical protein